MRVLHAIPSLSPAHGGPSQALPMMERALSAVGVVVETVTTDDDGRRRRVNKPLGRPLNENGAVRWYFPKQMEFYKVSVPLLRWLPREVRRFDVVHVHALFSFASVAAAWTVRCACVPYVIRPLGVLNRYGMTRRRALTKRASFRGIEGPLLRDAAAVHFTSGPEQAEAEMLGAPMRSVVIPLGIEHEAPGDREAFLAAHPALRNRIRVLFLSRLDPKKNVEGLLRALNLLPAEFGDLALVVCGDGAVDYSAELRRLADTLGIADRVVWTGRLEGEAKSAALAAADLFLLPSFSENFGIAAVEALAAGLPCVLGRGVAIAEEIQAAGAGVCVDAAPEAIAEGIRALSPGWRSKAVGRRPGATPCGRKVLFHQNGRGPSPTVLPDPRALRANH